MSNYIADKVRECSDIVTVIERSIRLEHVGTHWFGSCPFCDNDGKTFSVSRKRGTYYCFSCKTSGNAIDFTMRFKRIPYDSAVKVLAQRVLN